MPSRHSLVMPSRQSLVMPSRQSLVMPSRQSLMMPSSDPQDRIVYPIHKLMIDSKSTPVFSNRYAQVMHLSFVTTPSQSRGRTGDSRTNVLCFYFCIVPLVQGKCQEFVVQCEKYCGGGGGEMSWFFKLVVPAVCGL